MSDLVYPAMSPDLQVQFWSRLQVMRGQYLADALSTTVRGDQCFPRSMLNCLLSSAINGLQHLPHSIYAVRCYMLFPASSAIGRCFSGITDFFMGSHRRNSMVKGHSDAFVPWKNPEG